MLIKSLLLFWITIIIVEGQIITSAINFLMRGGRRLNEEVKDQTYILKEYDFIIVGAGTAGCVLANRLSENPKWKILLIEAGQHENLLMDIPALVHYLQQMTVNWAYKTETSNTSCLAMHNNQCNWPRGKVMGGSSVLNYMAFTRGNRKDYDRWADLGNKGWSYDDVLPYFKKLENSMISNEDAGYHGHGGPLTVSNIKYKTPVCKAFVKAAVETGHPKVDYNGATQIGVSYLQTTIKNGARDSSNAAYLYPIRDRPNLHVKKLSHVTNIIIDRKTKIAVGVRLYNNGRYYIIKARNEVIVSAGAINSPQILMLSGIGPAEHLREMGIQPIVNLPVGHNLMDHIAPGALTFITNSTVITTAQTVTLDNLVKYANTGEGPVAVPGALESLAFYELDNPNDPNGYPDIELLQIGGSIVASDIFLPNFGIRSDFYNEMFKQIDNSRINSFMVFPMVLRPKSRGKILLENQNPFRHPIIKANYFDHPYDMDIAVRGIKKTLELINTTAFRKIDAKLYNEPAPGCKHLLFKSDEYWACFTRHLTFTIYHYSGTCKMAPINDPTGVVDPRLRVKGIKNLRVIDASIMPEIIAGHTNAPVYMIAEKASDMIKEDWGIQTH